MTKENKIKEAWGNLWDRVKDNLKDNGWSDLKEVFGDGGNTKILHGPALDTLDHYDPKYCYYKRPLSLRGIENNNGWKKLPLKDFLKTGFYLIRCHVPETNVEQFLLHEVKDSDAGMLGYHYATHYKKIEASEKPPIY